MNKAGASVRREHERRRRNDRARLRRNLPAKLAVIAGVVVVVYVGEVASLGAILG